MKNIDDLIARLRDLHVLGGQPTIKEAADYLEGLRDQKPSAFMYQHDETGRTVILPASELDQYLPRYGTKIPLYASPVLPPEQGERVLMYRMGGSEWRESSYSEPQDFPGHEYRYATLDPAEQMEGSNG